MQAADIDAGNVPELYVKTLRSSRIETVCGAGYSGSVHAQTKMRKQPHAQYKSLKNSASHGAGPAGEGRLTRRAEQAQSCMIADRESATRADAVNRSEAMAAAKREQAGIGNRGWK